GAPAAHAQGRSRDAAERARARAEVHGAGGARRRRGRRETAARTPVATRNPSAPELSRALFAPRAVALVGASGDPAKNTARPQRYLRKHGFSGPIFPVNPHRKEILGEAAYKNIL